jgi:hypothetical protein
LYIYSGIWGVLEGLKDGSRDGVYEDEIVCECGFKDCGAKYGC